MFIWIHLVQGFLHFAEKGFGPNHRFTAWVLLYLAGLNIRRGNIAKAEMMYVRVLQIREEALGLDHLKVAEVLDYLAVLYTEMMDHAKAKPIFFRALKIRGKKIPKYEDSESMAGEPQVIRLS